MNNIAALDELCLAHLEESASHKCVDNVCVHDTNSSAFSVSATLKRIRELVLNGQLQEALKLANAIAPGALEYPNFQLNLRLHQVDELVRSAALREPKRTSALTTDEHTLGAMKKLLPTYDDALQYVQSVVAPYAQEAFPEAYEIFLKRMLVFVFPERALYIQERRQEIAGVIVSTLRARLNAPISRLSLLIRYLVNIQQGYGAEFIPLNGPSYSNLSSILISLFPPRASETETNDNGLLIPKQPFPWNLDPRPLPHGSSNRNFADVDVLALCDSLHTPQDKMLESLRYANGDANVALRCELSLIRMDEERLDLLVDEYCSARGLGQNVDGETTWSTQCLRQMREYAKAGNTSGLIRIALELNPRLLEDSPLLDFRFGQAALIEAVCEKNFASVLKLVQGKLGPLANKNSQLYNELRETTLLILFPDTVEPVVKSKPNLLTARDVGGSGNDETAMDIEGSDNDMLESVCRTTAEKCSAKALAGLVNKGVSPLMEEPELLVLMKKLLDTHVKWVTASGSVDHFSEFLSISELTRDDESVGVASSTSMRATAGESALAEGSDSDTHERNQKILTLMEFLAVSRAEAIHILDSHPATENPQTIIMAVLGG